MAPKRGRKVLGDNPAEKQLTRTYIGEKKTPDPNQKSADSSKFFYHSIRTLSSFAETATDRSEGVAEMERSQAPVNLPQATPRSDR